MIKLRWLLILLLLLMATGASAQSNDCDRGAPCGRVPWALPFLPYLRSPTPMPTAIRTSTPPVTATPSTPTATATQMATIQLDNVIDIVGTVQAAITLTPPSYDLFVATYSVEELEDNTRVFFGYVKGLSDVNFGVFSPAFVFVIFAFLFVIGFRLILITSGVARSIINWAMPAISRVVSLVIDIVSAIIDFIIGLF
jgi:hypothetical protein